MRTILLISLFLFSIHAPGQIVPSSCDAPDSIIEKYTEDAYRMTMWNFFRNNISYKDSVHIPYSHVDTVMRALLAVYNATGLPARDTVISMFDVHTFRRIYMNEMGLWADSGLTWMHQLRLGIVPTGDSAIDTIMSLYNLRLYSYYGFPNQAQHSVLFDTDSNYNVIPLCSLFMAIPGVWSSDGVEDVGSGNDITDSIFIDHHVELTYSIGWGDCMVGCIYRRYWKFSVDTNCSVEYLGSYGSDISVIAGVANHEKHTISVSPVPFKEYIRLNGVNNPFNYSISSLSGNVMTEGTSMNGVVDNLEFLSPGIYFLRIHTETENFVFKIIK